MRLSVVDSQLCVGCQSCMFACARRQGEGGLARSRIGVKSAGGMAHGFVVVVCRACPQPSCATVCPTGALAARDNRGVRYDADLCIGCGNCAEACPLGAVFWEDEIGKPLICTYCGYCARYCPHGVLEFEKKEGAHTE